jgi:hypothetical protein
LRSTHSSPSRREILRFLYPSGAASISIALRPDHALAINTEPDIDWYRPESVTDGQYSGKEWTGPCWPKPADEPSISWKDFVKAMKSGDVTVVDFVGKRYEGEKVGGG